MTDAIHLRPSDFHWNCKKKRTIKLFLALELTADSDAFRRLPFTFGLNSKLFHTYARGALEQRTALVHDENSLFRFNSRPIGQKGGIAFTFGRSTHDVTRVYYSR